MFPSSENARPDNTTVEDDEEGYDTDIYTEAKHINKSLPKTLTSAIIDESFQKSKELPVITGASNPVLSIEQNKNMVYIILPSFSHLFSTDNILLDKGNENLETICMRLAGNK